MWATGISLVFVLGSGLIALGAGAFAEPPVDRAGTFAAINAQFTPSSTTGPADPAAPPTTRRGTSQPRRAGSIDVSTTAPGSGERPMAAATSEPSPRTEVEGHDSTTGRAGARASDDDAHEPPEREPQEHEERDD